MAQPIYFGMCVGGPKSGQRIMTYERTYQLARMGQFMRPTPPGEDDWEHWAEVNRGHYEWDSGHWWWKGWALKR